MGSPEPSDDQRRDMRCALPGFDERRWSSGEEAPRPFMGRLPIYGVTDPDDPLLDDPMLPRDDAADGCPGAWYRAEFCNSLLKYERILTEHGFSANLLAERCTDRLVLEALAYLECERVRARAHWMTVRTTAKE